MVMYIPFLNMDDSRERQDSADFLEVETTENDDIMEKKEGVEQC